MKDDKLIGGVGLHLIGSTNITDRDMNEIVPKAEENG